METPNTHTIDLNERDRQLRVQAVTQISRRRNFFTHVAVYLIGNIFLIAVWATNEYYNAGGWPTALRTGRKNHDWDPWIIYPLMAGTLALLVHAWIVYGRRPPTERDIAREVKRLKSEVS